MAKLLAAGARRRGGLETTPGRCANLDYCSIGMQRVLVEIPVSEPFVCPECGGRLRPPGRIGRRSVMPALRVGLFILGVGLGVAAGYLLGRGQPAMKRMAAAASRDTVDEVNTARSMLGLPKLAADAMRPAAAEGPGPEPGPGPGPGPSPLPPLVEAQPFPAHAPALDLADPPARLAGEQSFGQVTIDCALGAVQIRPTCRMTDLRGADAFSARAVPWLESLAVQYPPGTSHGAAALLDHRWRVIFQDFAGGPPASGPAEAGPVKAPPAKKSRHRQG